MQIKMQQDTSKTSAATYKWRSLIINLLNGLFCLLLGVEEKQQQPKTAKKWTKETCFEEFSGWTKKERKKQKVRNCH